MELVDKPEVGQIWISKKSDNPFSKDLEVVIRDVKGEYVSYGYDVTSIKKDELTSSRHLDSFCRSYEPKKTEQVLLTWSESENSDLFYYGNGVVVDAKSGAWEVVGVTSDWESTTGTSSSLSTNTTGHDLTKSDDQSFTITTDAFPESYITVDSASAFSSFSIVLPTRENKSCMGGEIWYNGSDLMTCKDGKPVKLLTESSLTEVHHFHTTKEKGNDMFTFGNLCILIVLMFVVAKLANRVNWYVFLYPVKKFFGFTKRTAKKVEEELNEVKEEWNKIEE